MQNKIDEKRQAEFEEKKAEKKRKEAQIVYISFMYILPVLVVLFLYII